MQERIEQYIRGEFNSEEEDELWEIFLAEPVWYQYFEIWINVMPFGKNIMNSRKAFKLY